MVLYLFGKANACQPKLGAEFRPGVTEISPSNPILPVRATSPTTRMSDELIKAAAQGSIVHSWELHVSAVQGCYCLRRRELRKKCPLWMGTTLCSTALRAEFSLYSSPQLEPFAQCTACTVVLPTEACSCQGLRSPLGENSSGWRRVPGVSGRGSEAGGIRDLGGTLLPCLSLCSEWSTLPGSARGKLFRKTTRKKGLRDKGITYANTRRCKTSGLPGE